MIEVTEEMIQGFAGKVRIIDLEISCEDREESDDEGDTEAETDMDSTSDYSP